MIPPMNEKTRQVGRPRIDPSERQIEIFMDAIDNRYGITQARGMAGITQRQLDRLRELPRFDYFLRLRLEYYRRYTLPGADADLAAIIERECKTAPIYWKPWEEIRQELDERRDRNSLTTAAAMREPEAPIPPNPEDAEVQF